MLRKYLHHCAILAVLVKVDVEIEMSECRLKKFFKATCVSYIVCICVHIFKLVYVYICVHMSLMYLLFFLYTYI